MSENNDVLIFQDEQEEQQVAYQPALAPWRVLIVDDEPSIHQATKFALQDCVILDRQLSFQSCFSAKEAQALLAEDSDYAVILLDVVMETQDAGLQLASIIRQQLALQLPRIILRTGQPGYAPELQVIQQYDINDYKAKAELTRTHLITSLTSALRSYQQLLTIRDINLNLEARIQERSQELLRAQEKVAALEKAAALGRLVRGYAHEVNTPLAVASSNLRLLTELLLEPMDAAQLADAQDLLQDASQGLVRIGKITKDLQLFDLSHQQVAGQCLLGQLVNYCQMACQQQSIVFQLDSQLELTTWVSANAQALESIIDQLLDNAIKAMEQQQEPTISLVLRPSSDAKQVILTLADNGVGMAPEVLAKAIDPFFTTRPIGAGQGLGLSLVANRVQCMGGQLEVHSELGEGSAISLWLPILSQGNS